MNAQKPTKVLRYRRSQSLPEIKKRDESHEAPDGKNGERRDDKNAGDYLFLAPFSPSHIALPNEDEPQHLVT